MRLWCEALCLTRLRVSLRLQRADLQPYNRYDADLRLLSRIPDSHQAGAPRGLRAAFDKAESRTRSSAAGIRPLRVTSGYRISVNRQPVKMHARAIAFVILADFGGPLRRSSPTFVSSQTLRHPKLGGDIPPPCHIGKIEMC